MLKTTANTSEICRRFLAKIIEREEAVLQFSNTRSYEETQEYLSVLNQTDEQIYEKQRIMKIRHLWDGPVWTVWELKQIGVPTVFDKPEKGF